MRLCGICTLNYSLHSLKFGLCSLKCGQHTISMLRLSDKLTATYHRILFFFIHKIPMVVETGTTWYLMLQILNLPPQTNKQAWMRKWPIHTHTHTHTHTHHGIEKGTICNPSKTKLCSRHHIMTYHDSVFHTEISVQWYSE